MLKTATITPAHPKWAKTHSFPDARPQPKLKPQAYLFTHPSPSPPRRALYPWGYVEDFDEARTQLGKGASSGKAPVSQAGVGGWENRQGRAV
jgi:hypothetical protein